nr:copper homeostasis protein cutC homolog [Cavia porcellus]
MGVLQVVKQSVQIPVFVMIRPRGGDFLYSDREIEVMKADIQLAKLYGADGLVFGALTEDGYIDKELCMSLVALCRPLPVTFHRAFDMVHDPMAALETLVTLGFERVLTSGCDSSALEGLPLIKRLIDQPPFGKNSHAGSWHSGAVQDFGCKRQDCDNARRWYN